LIKLYYCYEFLLELCERKYNKIINIYLCLYIDIERPFSLNQW